MIRATQSAILTLALTACGPSVVPDPTGEESSCDPWVDVCEISLQPSIDTQVILELDNARITVDPTSDMSGVQEDGFVWASVSRYLVLQSQIELRGICLLPDTFATLADVPTDASVCDCDSGAGCWASTAYFGLVGQGEDEYVDAGLLLRSASGELYRGRVLFADPQLDPSTLTIEYQGVM